MGCATAEFKPYVGKQMDWPTAPGSFMEEDKAVPVYFGVPRQRYEVLGFLDCEVAPARKRGLIAFAAEEAVRREADAVIVVEQGEKYRGSVGSDSGSTTALFSGTAKVLLIRFIGEPSEGEPSHGGVDANSPAAKTPPIYDSRVDRSIRGLVKTRITSRPEGVPIQVNDQMVGRTPIVYVFHQDGGKRFVGNATVVAVAEGEGQITQQKQFLDPNFPSFGTSDMVPEDILFEMTNAVPTLERKARAFRGRISEKPGEP